MPSTHIYTLSLHDALPIYDRAVAADRRARHLSRGGPARFDFAHARPARRRRRALHGRARCAARLADLQIAAGHHRDSRDGRIVDRKSTRLNSSHVEISYAVHPYLHSFPTRRSSDLRPCCRGRSPSSASIPRWTRSIRLRACSTRASSAKSITRSRAMCSASCRPTNRCRTSSRFSGWTNCRSEEHTSELQSRRDLVCRPPISTLFPYTTLFRSTTVLSRQIAELGIYPAVDPLDSTSRMLDPRVVGEEHYTVARDVQRVLQTYKSLQDIIAILGMDEL